LTDFDLKNGSTIRCAKHARNGEYGWYVDGVLVLATSKSMDFGTVATDTRTNSPLSLLGWSVPDDWEMIPYVQATAGSCRFSAIELEK
jgi:hypothetical protein